MLTAESDKKKKEKREREREREKEKTLLFSPHKHFYAAFINIIMKQLFCGKRCLTDTVTLCALQFFVTWSFIKVSRLMGADLKYKIRGLERRRELCLVFIFQ